MLQPLAIGLREGLAAFVVVGVMLAIFRRAGEGQLLMATRWGIVVSLLATPVAGLLFSGAANQALWEGVLALGAAALVAAMTIHLWHTTRRRRERFAPGRLTWVATLASTVLMITRGSMEIALLLGTMLWQVPARDVILGTAAGTALAIVVAWVWARFVRHMQRPHFRHVTVIFLILFFVQLLIDGLHEIAEAGVLAGTDRFHRATEPFSSDGVYGQYAPFLLVGLPIAWWLVAIFWGHGKASDGRIAHMGR